MSPFGDDDQLLAVNEALESSPAFYPKGRTGELRYSMGMSSEEAAVALGIAVPTAKQWWAYA